MARRLVIVTRPATAGQRLTQRLLAAGHDAVWWPAFSIGPAADPAAVRATLARLADFDLAVFVSPAAVRAVEQAGCSWPAGTRAGAVGEATAAELRTALGLPAAALIAPSGDDGGSEAFWEACCEQAVTPRRVLILRAQHGREWLGERFTASGAEVQTLAVYRRDDHELDAASRDWLHARQNAGTVVTVFSSSEAVAALDRQLAGAPGAAAWLRVGRALATHPRIAGRLLAAGYKRVQTVEPDDEAVLAQLESAEPS